MSLYDEVALRFFNKEGGSLSPREEEEVKRIDALNQLSLGDFLLLPERDQDMAQTLWAAKVIEANIESEKARREQIRARWALPTPN